MVPPISNQTTFSYQLKRIKHSRSIRISVHGDGKVVVTAPPRSSLADIKQFVNSKSGWVLEQVARCHDAARDKTALGQGESGYRQFKDRALRLIKERLAQLNQGYNYEYGRICVRNQKHAWGSCSADKNLNFNYRLFFLPSALCDYIIVHELCHLAELNHSAAFWRLVAATVPDYKDRRKELKKYIIR